MDIKLTKEEYLMLVESVHIASHIREDDSLVEFEQTLMESGYKAGLDGMVMKEKDEYVLNTLISRAIHDEIDVYEDGIFWDNLAQELAERDLRFIRSPEDILTLDKKEYDLIIDGQADRYADEFDEHGVDHLTLTHPLEVI